VSVKISPMDSDSHLEVTHVVSADEDTEPPREPSRGEPTDIVTTFSLFKDYLDKKLVILKEDLKEEAQNTTDSVAKKLKETFELTFKYEGNKQQHKCNRGLADQVSVAKKLKPWNERKRPR